MPSFGRRAVASPQPKPVRPLDELAALREEFLEQERQRRAELARRNGEMSELAVTYDAKPAGKAGPGSKTISERSVGMAYALWALFGFVSAHRFYLGATRSAWVQAAVFVSGFVIMQIVENNPEAGMLVFAGILLLMAWGIWIIADAFLTLRLARKRDQGEDLYTAFA